MKKVLSMLLAIVMVFGMIPVNAFAEENEAPVITFETTFSPDLNRGDTFTVTAKIANNPGIASFTHSLTWNENVITLVDFVREDEIPISDVFAEPDGYPDFGVFTYASKTNKTKNGVLYSVEFRINESGSGNLNLGLTTMEFGREFTIADKEGKDITITHDFTALEKLNYGGPAMPEDAAFSAITTNASSGPFIKAIIPQGYVEFESNEVPYYVAYIPEDATEAYITSSYQRVMTVFDELRNPVESCEAYAADIENDWATLNISYDFTKKGDDVTVTLPMEMVSNSWTGLVELFFAGDAEAPALHAFGIQDSENACLALISFSYAEPPHNIIINNTTGCSITALVYDEEEDGYLENTMAVPGETVILECVVDDAYLLQEIQAFCGENRVSVSADKPFRFEMPAGDVEITAICVPKASATEYTITKNPMANGSVEAKANGAEVTKAEAGTVITLEATAGEGYKLDTLTVTKNGTAVPVSDNQFTMPEGNVTISATFVELEVPEFAINKAEMTGGSVTIKAGEAEVSTAAAKTEITLEAAANDGYTFTSVAVTKDGMTGEEANVTVADNKFTMPSCAVTVSAEFAPIDYTVTVDDGIEHGSVTASKTENTHVGEEITLTVSPEEGYQLKEGTLAVTTTGADGESVPVTVTDNKFTMPAGNVTITAEFEKPSYTITLDVIGEGTIELEATTAHAGDTIDIGPCPSDEEYTLTSLIVQSGNTVVPVDEGYTFEMPAGNVVVKAVFGKINKITSIEIQHPILKSDEQGQPVMNLVTGYGETLNLNTVLGIADLAATQTVTWSSSDEGVASVDAEGKITPHKAGTAVITAVAADRSVLSLLGSENASASFTLNVTDPAAGYRVSLPQQDIDRVVNGQPFTVDVTFSHSDESVAGFNAYELKLAYDASKLTLNTKGSHNDSTGASIDIKDVDGDMTITCIGEEKIFAEGKLTLQFTPKEAADTHIALVSAKVATSQEALSQDAADAQVLDQVIQVKVTNYYVTLTEDFFGEQIAQPNQPYTFTAKDPNYNYDFTGSTMGTGDAPIQNNEDGSFTIPNVTGDIVIQATKTVKTFTADLAAGLSAVEEGAVPTYKTDFKVKVDSYDANKVYSFTVTIGGVSYTASFDKATGILTIYGEDITGDVIVTYTEKDPEPEKVYITFEGEYASHASGGSEVVVGSNYNFTINAQSGYTYTVTYKLQGEENETPLTPADGTHSYTITNLRKNVTIYINGTSDLVVDVLGDAEGEKEYLAVNEQAVFKVVATQTLAEGECLTYDGNAMYYNAAKNEWYYLVTVSESLNEAVVAEIMAKVHKASNLNFETMGEGCDVNGTRTVDINDAQLVYDIYNDKYDLDFNTVSMKKLLMADVNGNNGIEVTDAAYVVADILGITLSGGSTVTPDVPESSEG